MLLPESYLINPATIQNCTTVEKGLPLFTWFTRLNCAAQDYTIQSTWLLLDSNPAVNERRRLYIATTNKAKIWLAYSRGTTAHWCSTLMLLKQNPDFPLPYLHTYSWLGLTVDIMFPQWTRTRFGSNKICIWAQIYHTPSGIVSVL